MKGCKWTDYLGNPTDINKVIWADAHFRNSTGSGELQQIMTMSKTAEVQMRPLLLHRHVNTEYISTTYKRVSDFHWKLLEQKRGRPLGICLTLKVLSIDWV